MGDYYATDDIYDRSVFLAESPKGKVHLCDKERYTACGYLVQSPQWYKYVGAMKAVTCSICRRKLYQAV